VHKINHRRPEKPGSKKNKEVMTSPPEHDHSDSEEEKGSDDGS